MVYAEVGMSVWYYQHGDRSNPIAAIVTKTYPESVDLYILPPSSAGAVREGVIHVDDPRASDKRRQVYVVDVGLWEYTELSRDQVYFLLQRKKDEAAEQKKSKNHSKQLAEAAI